MGNFFAPFFQLCRKHGNISFGGQLWTCQCLCNLCGDQVDLASLHMYVLIDRELIRTMYNAGNLTMLAS
jgi:hypothetical protein